MEGRGGVLITGTSSGIGLETAVYLAECGFQVYATMRDLGRRDRLDAEAARRKVQLEVLQLDGTDERGIQETVQTVDARSGGIYALVNNAGIIVRGYFEDVSTEEMRRVFETNVFGTMAVTRAVLPFMRAGRRGRIVFMSSAGARIASPGASAYCASKFALEGFAESLAQELRPFGVQVSLVEPGFVKTELFEKNGNIAARARDAEGPYYHWFRRLEELTDDELRDPATSPGDVAKVVGRALTTPRPRLRYVVGRRARLLIGLRRCLPGELFERIWIREVLRRMSQPIRCQAGGHQEKSS